MNPSKILTTLAIVAGGLMMGSVPASAEEVTTPLNLRAGPGTGYGVVDVLARGERVDVVRRTGGWCEIRRPGPDGWVSCRYLAETGRPGRPDRTGRPDVDIEFSIPGFSFSIGDGRDRWTGRPGRPGRGGQVCFYEDVNYRGDQFCMRPGQSRSSLGNWNDEISSIRVRGGAEARVCEHNGFNGRCATIDRNVRNLGNRGNDMISSIRVR